MTKTEMTRGNSETLTITRTWREVHMVHAVDGNMVSQIRFTAPRAWQRARLAEWRNRLHAGGWQETDGER